jgi:hypothetical protein
MDAPLVHLDAARGDVGVTGWTDKTRPDNMDVDAQRAAQSRAIVSRKAEVFLQPAVDARVAIVIHGHTVRQTLVEYGYNTFA